MAKNLMVVMKMLRVNALYLTGGDKAKRIHCECSQVK